MTQEAKPTHILSFSRRNELLDSYEIIRESDSSYFTHKFRVSKKTLKVPSNSDWQPAHDGHVRPGTALDIDNELALNRKRAAFRRALNTIHQAGNFAGRTSYDMDFMSDDRAEALIEIASLIEKHGIVKQDF
jgi:hypothetical protein